MGLPSCPLPSTFASARSCCRAKRSARSGRKRGTDAWEAKWSYEDCKKESVPVLTLMAPLLLGGLQSWGEVVDAPAELIEGPVERIGQ